MQELNWIDRARRLQESAPDLSCALKAMLTEFNEQMPGITRDELAVISEARRAIRKAEGN